MRQYYVIYDGNCNLCVTFTQLLEKLDQSQLFDCLPMQDEARLQPLGVTSQDCQEGMMLIDIKRPEQRWQGSNAVEEITQLLPLGEGLIAAYRALPGMKAFGDGVYAQVRDNRYQWFGKRESTYYSPCTSGCETNQEEKKEEE